MNAQLKPSHLVKKQTKTFTKDLPNNHKIYVNVRYDDEYGNGHNSFAITGDIYSSQTSKSDRYHECGGCIHEEIAKHFPDLAHLIKWHLTSSDGPMHYVANTMYHARNTGYDGLHKGEHSAYTVDIRARTDTDGKKRVIYTSGTMYVNLQNNPNLEKSNQKEQARLDEVFDSIDPDLNPETVRVPCPWSLSEGKERDIESARSCAIWPDATLEQLLDEKQLTDRLPALLAEFKKDIESLGLVY